MQHPYQCIAIVKPPAASSNTPGYLLAACGSSLSSICVASGEVVSNWSSEDAVEKSLPVDAVNDESERPSKKQKGSATTSNFNAASNIIRLTVSPNNEHIVAVTDDKCIRVFSFTENGELYELSSRRMPKRPCAIQVLPDNTTILCGDKFGDVYSLPLLSRVKLDNGQEVDGSTGTAQEATPNRNHSKPFKPSATSKTVHTQRNLKSLAAQQNQKNLTPKSKEPLKFEHELLLGHVSMLTDLTYATEEINGKMRGYIFTADRDEHIRVSRAPPQSHVIEGYCLGHKEFVSKVCLIPGTDMLVSGGGDGWLGVWKWPEFRLRHKMAPSDAVDPNPTAVSGIWIVSAEGRQVVVVAREKIPGLSFVFVDQLMKNDFSGNMSVLGQFDNFVLDVVSIGNTVIMSFDSRDAKYKRLRAFNLRGTKTEKIQLLSDEQIDVKLEHANSIERVTVDEKGLDSLFYGVENLRKRGYAEEAEEDGLEGAV